MRLQIPDQQLRVSPRLPWGVAALAVLGPAMLWPALHRGSLLVAVAGVPALLFALRYAAGSWIRVSMQRGVSWRLASPFGTRLGSIALDPSAIAELRLESSLLGRLLGLWDLQFVAPDGTVSRRLRFFHGIAPLTEALHAYLQQNAAR